MTKPGWLIHLTAMLVTFLILTVFGTGMGEGRRQQSLPLPLLGAVEHVARRESWPVVGAVFEPVGGGRYAVETLSAFGLTRHEVDPLSGRVTGSERETLSGYFISFTHEDLGRAAVTLADAIRAVEAQSGGKAMRANTHRAGRHVEYWVTIPMENGAFRVFVVDGSKTPATVSSKS